MEGRRSERGRRERKIRIERAFYLHQFPNASEGCVSQSQGVFVVIPTVNNKRKKKNVFLFKPSPPKRKKKRKRKQPRLTQPLHTPPRQHVNPEKTGCAFSVRIRSPPKKTLDLPTPSPSPSPPPPQTHTPVKRLQPTTRTGVRVSFF